MKAKLLLRIVACVVLLVAVGGIVLLSVTPEITPADNKAWIAASYEQLRPDMTVKQVHEILGSDGDFRQDPNKDSASARPLIPFSSPKFEDSEDPAFTMHGGGFGTKYWWWDHGTIIINY